MNTALMYSAAAGGMLLGLVVGFVVGVVITVLALWVVSYAAKLDPDECESDVPDKIEVIPWPSTTAGRLDNSRGEK